MAERLSKHHGLGNDFLIALTDRLPLDAGAKAVAWCDRRRGIGADGLIYGIRSTNGSITMRLLNSDGSPAAVSGNGLRCLAQAIAIERGVPHLEVDITTPAGVRHCSVHTVAEPATVVATVDMGVVCPGPDPDTTDLVGAVGKLMPSVKRWDTADIGNPHVVFEVESFEGLDLMATGRAVEAHFEDGANVHFVRVAGPNQLELRVWERGAGITPACGSGATVAAAIFHRWAAVGPKVLVTMPGGDAVVDVRGPTTLTGPATHIADFAMPDA